MTTAEVFTAGRVASPMDEHNIKRTRYAHQISLVALSLLKQEAYSTYREEVQGSPEQFELWSMKCSEHVQVLVSDNQTGAHHVSICALLAGWGF